MNPAPMVKRAFFLLLLFSTFPGRSVEALTSGGEQAGKHKPAPELSELELVETGSAMEPGGILGRSGPMLVNHSTPLWMTSGTLQRVSTLLTAEGLL